MHAGTLSLPPTSPLSLSNAASSVRWSFWFAAFIIVLNLIDGLLTLAVVTAGLATEANPLMEATLSWGGVPFMLVKIALVSLGVYLLYLRRERRLASAALFGLTAVYGGIVAYHANSIDALARLLA